MSICSYSSIHRYLYVAPGTSLSNLLQKNHQRPKPGLLIKSSKILCEDLLNATDLALVLIFRWAAFLPFCHGWTTAGGTAMVAAISVPMQPRAKGADQQAAAAAFRENLPSWRDLFQLSALFESVVCTKAKAKSIFGQEQSCLCHVYAPKGIIVLPKLPTQRLRSGYVSCPVATHNIVSNEGPW